jgi:hypothetical protein
MFCLNVQLDLGDLGLRECACMGTVNDSFGQLQSRIVSVQLVIPPRVSVELREMLTRPARKAIEDALIERHQKIKERYAGFPDDYPRDNLEGA